MDPDEQEKKSHSRDHEERRLGIARERLLHEDPQLQARDFFFVDIFADFFAELFDIFIRAVLPELAQHPVAQARDAEDVLVGHGAPKSAAQKIDALVTDTSGSNLAKGFTAFLKDMKDNGGLPDNGRPDYVLTNFEAIVLDKQGHRSDAGAVRVEDGDDVGRLRKLFVRGPASVVGLSGPSRRSRTS